jgi:DNA invertase Pin-like site-specific DNA recombinase
MDAAQVVGYVRVSTEEQEREGVSLDAQRARLGAYCTMQGLELVEVVTDAAVSGTVPLGQRPGGARVVELLAGGLRHVLTVKLDRLFRDAADCLVVVRGWDKLGVSLHVVDLGGAAVDTSSSAGRFMLTVLAGVAEMERNQTAERTRAALAHLRARGRVYGGIPAGFRREGGVLVQDQEGARALEVARVMRGEGASLRAIGAELEAQGYRAPGGGTTWRPATLARILARPAQVQANVG